MKKVNRRDFINCSISAGVLAGLAPQQVFAAESKSISIAYNVNLPSWDPTVGLSSVNPTIQSIYRAVFDQYIGQNGDLSLKNGLLTGWGWNKDKTKVWLEVRKGVKWHNGDLFTPEDVVWSLQRAGNKDSGNPIGFIWSKIGNFTINNHRIEADVLQFEPTLFKWMAFLTGYIMPKKYYEKVGAQGFEKKPIGTGPYMVDKFERNAFVRLKANPNYWAGKAKVKTIIYNFMPDSSSRVAAIESGRADLTVDIPYDEYDRLIKKTGLKGVVTPISDIAMIFLNDIDVMEDKNVRMAAAHSINKKLIIQKLLNGHGVAIDTLQAPVYEAFDKSIQVEYNPSLAKKLLQKSGYSKNKPAKFTIQTTRGFKPKDYEMVQAIVGMWRKVGIHAEIEVYEIAKHFELRASDTLAPAAFYNWGNAIGDPTTSTGFAMFGPSPHSTWDTEDLDAMIGPLWGEKDEAKRIAGWKKVDRYIAENAYVIPLLQYVQPVVYKSKISVTENFAGAPEAYYMS